MDRSQYSRIENGKTASSFSAVLRIAKAIGVELTDLFRADEGFKDLNTFDKSVMEKVAFYAILVPHKEKIKR